MKHRSAPEATEPSQTTIDGPGSQLRKARERGHVLEGLAVALANIDAVIELIKTSPSSAEAKEKLLARSWKSDSVLAMLGEVGADACRPQSAP